MDLYKIKITYEYNSLCKTIFYITLFSTTRYTIYYRMFNEKGYQIGSGVIESACKHVVAERCKQAGMRWTKPGINAILFWRCLLKNQTFDDYWEAQHKQAA